ncbi:hypothetical protein N9N67_11090, partial [Bacteriovoracaceae bacterium]|nr:hypothetical protein [Bacteriovoracaceae bacterium]
MRISSKVLTLIFSLSFAMSAFAQVNSTLPGSEHVVLDHKLNRCITFDNVNQPTKTEKIVRKGARAAQTATTVVIIADAVGLIDAPNWTWIAGLGVSLGGEVASQIIGTGRKNIAASMAHSYRMVHSNTKIWSDDLYDRAKKVKRKVLKYVVKNYRNGDKVKKILNGEDKKIQEAGKAQYDSAIDELNQELDFCPSNKLVGQKKYIQIAAKKIAD